MWEGEMCFTVSSAVIYDTIEETGLNYDDFIDDFSAYDETFKPMVVKLTVENVHAKSLTDPPEFFSDGYVLSSKKNSVRKNLDRKMKVSGVPPAGCLWLMLILILTDRMTISIIK